MSREKGVLVSIEGIDASGKTTQAKLLVKSLKEMGYRVVYTKEPTDGFWGGILREKVLYGEKRVPAVVEALLFALDRFEHVENNIKPALKEGKNVVSDRYIHSSLAYQSAAGLDLNWIREINKFAPKPDIAIYIDVPPEFVVSRLKAKRSVMEKLENQRKVREAYLKLVEDKELIRVDGKRSIEDVQSQILEIVLKFLSKRS